MKKRLVAIVSLLFASGVLFAQNQNASTKKVYAGMTFGTFILGNVQVGDAKAGSRGTSVLNIDADSGGAPAGFTFDLALGYFVTPRLAIEGAFTFGVGPGYSENGRVSSQMFYSNYGYGSGKEFTARDRLSWGGVFGAFDAGVSYVLWTPKKPTNPFYINGKLSIGFLGYIHSPDKAGGLRYAEVTDWHSGEDPGPDFTSIYLLDVAEGFYLKPGFDFGAKVNDFRILINMHAKVFPAAFGKDQEVVMTDGSRQRTVKMTLPTWFMPNITLGAQYFFK
jgi:hypothetical protein